MLKRFSSTSKLFRDGNIIFLDCVVPHNSGQISTVQRKFIVVMVYLNIFTYISKDNCPKAITSTYNPKDKHFGEQPA